MLFLSPRFEDERKNDFGGTFPGGTIVRASLLARPDFLISWQKTRALVYEQALQETPSVAFRCRTTKTRDTAQTAAVGSNSSDTADSRQRNRGYTAQTARDSCCKGRNPCKRRSRSYTVAGNGEIHDGEAHEPERCS